MTKDQTYYLNLNGVNIGYSVHVKVSDHEIAMKDIQFTHDTPFFPDPDYTNDLTIWTRDKDRKVTKYTDLEEIFRYTKGNPYETGDSITYKYKTRKES